MANTDNLDFIKGKLQSSELESFRSKIYTLQGCFSVKGNIRAYLPQLDAEYNKANPGKPLSKKQHVDMESQCVSDPLRAWKPIGHSGFTVATGFDISQHSLWELKKMGFAGKLFNKLAPFTKGYSGQAPNGLPAFDSDELKEIDRRVMTYKMNGLSAHFDKDTKAKKFADLSPYYQTVLYSLYHQYQNGLFNSSKSINKIYVHAINGDWAKMSEDLKKINDGYENRRKAESNIVNEGIKSEKSKGDFNRPTAPFA